MPSPPLRGACGDDEPRLTLVGQHRLVGVGEGGELAKAEPVIAEVVSHTLSPFLSCDYIMSQLGLIVKSFFEIFFR